MAAKIPDGVPIPDHRKIARAVQPRLQGPSPALQTRLDNANQTLDRVASVLNRGGSGPRNPILSRLGTQAQIHLAKGDRIRGVFIYQDPAFLGVNLAPQLVVLSPDVYGFTFQPGVGQSVAGTPATGAVRNFFRVDTDNGTFEREFWVKTKDADIIAINGIPALDPITLDPVPFALETVDASRPWIDKQIDFFVSWNDEFQVLHNAKQPELDPGFLKAYGGARFVSFFDSALPIPATRFSKVLDEPYGPGAVTFNSTQVVAGLVGNITKVTLGFHILHNNTNTLEVRLKAPDGTKIDITIGNGGISDYGTSCADDTTKTIADDAAVATFPASSNPFAGPHKPDSPLSGFNGKSGAAINGTWTLELTDTFVSSPGGTLKCWHVEIETDGTTPGQEGQGTEVNPVTDAPIEDQHLIQIQNTTGDKDITVRFRSKAGSLFFVDCPIKFNVTTQLVPDCDEPIIGEGEACAAVLLKVGTPLPPGTPDMISQPGVQVVAGTPGEPLTQDLWIFTIRGVIVGGVHELLVSRWKQVADVKDVAGARLSRVRPDEVYLPLVLASSTPVSPGSPYGDPKRLVIALSAIQEKADLTALLNFYVKDGDLHSTAIPILGPSSRDICFFPEGDQGGEVLCGY